MTARKQVPIEEGLFTTPRAGPQQAHLIGNRCTRCGMVFFPRRKWCVKCCTQEMQTIELSRQGKVHASTVMHYAPPLYRGTLPYVIANVELPEGVIVPGLVTEWPSTEPCPIGLPVELTVEKFAEEEDNDIIAWKFRPIGGPHAKASGPEGVPK